MTDGFDVVLEASVRERTDLSLNVAERLGAAEQNIENSEIR